MRREGLLAFAVAVAAVAAGLAAHAEGRHYYDEDKDKQHRTIVGKCRAFECPAEQRPVQKSSEAYRMWAYDSCSILSLHERERLTDLSQCCTIKYVCLQTCGISIQECFDHYWKCVESSCSGLDAQKCLYDAQTNDLNHMKLVQDGLWRGRWMKEGENCAAFQENQRASCDCVPSAEVDGRLQERLEAFYRDYAPEKLNKKGNVKDKAFWKAWRGKRPEMFFRLYMSYREKAVNIQNVAHRRGAVPKESHGYGASVEL